MAMETQASKFVLMSSLAFQSLFLWLNAYCVVSVSATMIPVAA